MFFKKGKMHDAKPVMKERPPMKKEIPKHTDTSNHIPNNPPPDRSIALDLTKYVAHLGEMDLTEDEQTQLLLSLCTLLQGFIDLGFGLHPAPKTCGQLPEIAPGDMSGDGLSALHSLDPAIVDQLDEVNHGFVEKGGEG